MSVRGRDRDRPSPGGTPTRGSPRPPPQVYEPAEDTALLLAALAEHEPDLRGRRVADIGTGSGAIGATLMARGARVVAVDISPPAAVATRALGVPVVRGDLLSALRGPFDVVAFNAPYLPSAPEERLGGWIDRAFHGGEGGVEVSARFVSDLPRVLGPGGRAYLVVSSRADLDALRAALLWPATAVASARFFFEQIAVWRISSPTA